MNHFCASINNSGDGRVSFCCERESSDQVNRNVSPWCVSSFNGVEKSIRFICGGFGSLADVTLSDVSVDVFFDTRPGE